MRAVVLCALILSSCGGSSGTDAGDRIDATAAIVDGPSGSADAPSAIDAALIVDATAADASTVGLGPVDCRSTTDCPGISSCTVTAPGGVCNGCGGAGDCPRGTSCGQFGACVRDCNGDGDCSAGKRCNGSGQCVIRTCGTNTPCPAPYVCAGTLCQRPACNAQTPCPSPMTCGTNSVCLEP